MSVTNNCGGNGACGGNKGKTLIRAVVGLGLGLMIVSYVVSVKSDLFRAQIVSDPVTEETEIVVDAGMTGEDLFAAPSGVPTEEEGFFAAEETTSEGLFAVAEDTTEEALLEEAAEEEMIEEDFVIVPPEVPTAPAPIIPEEVEEPVAPVFEEPVEPVVEEVALEDDLMQAPMEQELVETGLNAYLVILLIAMAVWAGSIVLRKEATAEVISGLMNNK